MTSRFFRFAILFVLLLLMAQVAQPYIFRLMYSATTPKIVVPRGNLSEAEQSTIALFDQVSPSVVQVVGRQSGESAFGDETEGTGVQSGRGEAHRKFAGAGDHVIVGHDIAGPIPDWRRHRGVPEPERNCCSTTAFSDSRPRCTDIVWSR
jgi:2-alkenal reductase